MPVTCMTSSHRIVGVMKAVRESVQTRQRGKCVCGVFDEFQPFQWQSLIDTKDVPNGIAPATLPSTRKTIRLTDAP
ncbi:unnamed protein product [Strongylus vulgaris]|uniref:Uncharacterized protein n=1 Tax=Strongylus vulgaris TaxID=40348 RepID=A0A3P7IE87_STRVU|nr:unnamed protein product [Strongylus vulgaris]